MTPTAHADLPQADAHRAGPVERIRPPAENDPQVRPALPVQALHASLRYFSDIVQAQEERLAARQHEIDSLAGELSQRRTEIDERDADQLVNSGERVRELSIHSVLLDALVRRGIEEQPVRENIDRAARIRHACPQLGTVDFDAL